VSPVGSKRGSPSGVKVLEPVTWRPRAGDARNVLGRFSYISQSPMNIFSLHATLAKFGSASWTATRIDELGSGGET